MRSSRVMIGLFLVVLGALGAFLTPLKFGVVPRVSHDLDPLFAEAGALYSVDPALLKAVAWRESRLRPDARGGAGEIGLMQLTDMASFEWADAEGRHEFHPEHLVHPRTNALAGAYYLAKMLRRYEDKDAPLIYALADYNAGRTPVLKWLKEGGDTNSQVFLNRIDYPTTRAYITNVMRHYRDFRRSFHYGTNVAPATAPSSPLETASLGPLRGREPSASADRP